VLVFQVFVDDLAAGDGFSFLSHAYMSANALLDSMPGEHELIRR